MRQNSERETVEGETSTIRHEERAEVGTVWRDACAVRARKHVEYERHDELVPHRFEEVELVRAAAAEADFGEIETLPDGSISIPVFEEELVVTTRTVLKERVIVRKRVVEDEQRVATSSRSASRSRPTRASRSKAPETGWGGRTAAPFPPERASRPTPRRVPRADSG